jgi:L-aspartate oxidase
VRFDADRDGRLAPGLEGGHSVRRVVHAGGSATGRRVVRQLSALVAEQPRIAVLEQASARALWRSEERCAGLLCEDGRVVVASRAVILSTGGCAAMWARTTNPPGSQGTGLVLADRAGAALADLELLQFHPTAVIGVAGREGFLVTEAIRGEGATLHDAAGERFVDELLPRDEVSRAIQARLQESGERSVGLDMRHVDPTHFPNVVSALRDAGLDPTRELIPVAPAAHYTMGGIVADLHSQSTLPGLYAVGESSCTGLHGANRLASNSLLEGLVYGGRVAEALDETGALSLPAGAFDADWQTPTPQDLSDDPNAEAYNRSDLQALMWESVGLSRTADGLREAQETLRGWRTPEVTDAKAAEDANLLLVARAVTASALRRTESRGGHFRADFPATDPVQATHSGLVLAR